MEAQWVRNEVVDNKSIYKLRFSINVRDLGHQQVHDLLWGPGSGVGCASGSADDHTRSL